MTSFQFTLNKRLRALGLEGKQAWGMVHDGALQLQDEKGHLVRIGVECLARVRVGYIDGKHRTYRTLLWRDAMDTPLEIVPLKHSWREYRDVVNAFVQLMAQDQRLDRIETGSSQFDAIAGPSLMAIPALGGKAVSLFVLTNEPWWGRMMVPLIPTIVLAILVWLAIKRYWPRPLQNLQDLRMQLPPA
ncbi:MAG: hypothetical protein ACO1Q7_16985 [Gemmatimonas sp.]